MLRILALLIFKVTGWKTQGGLPKGIHKAVMVAAPHTSNWDFIYARAALFIMRIPVRFTIKKEWLRFPLSLILNPLGALPIDRTPKEKGKKKQSTVQVMTNLFKKHDRLIILVTPEGTRKRVDKWKTGFYYVALHADVPIILAYLDYAKKEAGIGPVLQPTGNIEADIEAAKSFYRKVTPKFPEQGIF